jgi:hypothetical protein
VRVRVVHSRHTATTEGALGRKAEELCCPRDVVGGIAVVSVTEVGSQQRQERLVIGVLSMARGQTRDGKSMPQVMRSQGFRNVLVETCERASLG